MTISWNSDIICLYLGMKNKSPKLDNKVLRSIWEASRHLVVPSKKKYKRKDKHNKGYGREERS